MYQKDIKTVDLPVSNNGRILNLDFKDIIPDHKGIYVVELRSKDDYWIKARKIVSISDIGLIAKAGKNNMYIFANSIETAKPLSKVKIELTGRNNQSLGFVETNNDGYAIYDFKKMPASGFDPALVTATLDNDFNALPFNRTKIGTSRFEIEGKTTNLAGFDAYIYGERDIYRPGETAHLSVIIRDDNWTVPGQVPVILKVISPNGKVFKTIKKSLDAQGAMESEVIFPATAPTGSYSIEAYTSTDVFLNSKSIKLEEFVPDRIRVTVNPSAKDLNLGQTLNLNIQANNLFGPPAANRNYEVQERIKRSYFYCKQYNSYYFGLTGGETYFESNLRTGKTDEKGTASEDYSYEESYSDMGILSADYYITVFDETGRPVNRNVSVDVYTQDKFYGILLNDYYNRTEKDRKSVV